MTYAITDKSTHAGEPIELYKFAGPVAALTYYYTSYSEDVLYDGNTYVPRAIERGVIAGATHSDPPELSIVIPASSQLVQEYVFKTPPRSLDLTIYRLHSPTGIVTEYWKGPITGFNVQGNKASLRSPSILDDPMRTQVPSVYFQGICNHVLYDARCTKVAADYVFNTTISVISGDTVTVTSDDSHVDGYYDAGEIVRVLDGERRMILDHTGNVLTLSAPFRELVVANSVNLYAGCKHTLAACRDDFDNIINYGGHAYIPNINPFLNGLKGS